MLETTLRGRYKIIRNLAAGGFGATFIAEDRDMPGHPLCVVKQLSPQSKDAFTLQMAKRLFDSEALFLYQLGSHDQIPRLLAHFEVDRQFYLVQELIEGRDLNRELAEVKRWSEGETIAFLLDILQVLEFVHQKNVIHRDIKPSNIIRRAADGKLVLIDFGAVKQIGSAEVDDRGQVSATVAIGTRGYMANEQAGGHPRPSSDIYSVGAIAIQALTGVHPLELQKKHGTLEEVWLNQARVSPELAKIIDKMARSNLGERYQSAAEVLRSLQPLAKPHQSKQQSLWQRVGRMLVTPIDKLFTGEQAVDSQSAAPLPPTEPLPESARSQPTAPTEKRSPAAETPTVSTEAKSKIFISYHSSEPDRSLARELYQALLADGHQIFMAGETASMEKQWPQRIGEELEQGDYFVLLLSAQSAGSELVVEEVRKAKALRDASSKCKPAMIPIRVNLPDGAPLSYELRCYLNQFPQRHWHSPADSNSLVQEIRHLLAIGEAPTTTEAVEELPTVTPAVPSPEDVPLPAAEPELPDGQVDLASIFYIERPAIESRAYPEIKRPGALIRIKAPRQMGKTSLMARILHQASQQNYQIVPLSFQLADAKVLTDLDRFLRWFCANVGRRLRLPNRLNEMWDAEMFGSKDNCTAYFEEYLLSEVDAPLVLGLDEVDRIFEHPEIADDFFGLLRAWHEEAKSRDIWKKLRLVVVHSTEIYIPMNINQSPFNVGLPVELPEFNPEQVLDLAKRHGLDWTVQPVEQLMAMVGGHPYLVRLALYHIARKEMTLEQVLREAPTEAGLYRDHLRRFLWMIQQQSDLVEAFQQVATASGSTHLQPAQAFRLHSMGLVHLEGNQVRLRCDLYRQYFGGTAKKQVQELAI